MIYKNIYENGQSIIEVLIALAAATIIISAVVGAVISALSNESFSIKHNQATQLAQEGLDVVRNISQTDWSNFLTYDGKYCLGNSEVIPVFIGAGSCPENVNSFIREITIEQNSCVSPTPPTTINAKVSVVVKWADGKCSGSEQYCHKAILTSCYFKP